MRFEFIPCPSLPGLAWCARLRRGSGIISVFHGPWVETRETWFAEGAWTGPFEHGEPDRARFLVGSAGVLRAERAVFCTQSDLIERLYAVRTDGELFVSNSWVFVLAMTGDEPDPGYPFYYHDLRAHIRDGIARKHKSIHSRSGRRVELHDHCQLAIDSELRAERIEKPAFERPASFAAYHALLEAVLAEVLENAASPLRQHRHYAGLATVSGGYDSNALAVLLARLGVCEALTFYAGERTNDSGAELARRLGMRVSEHSRTAFRTAPGVDEAEFFAGPRGPDVVLAVSEAQLAGKLLVIGRYGDVLFGMDPAKRLGDFRTTRASEIAGTTLLEFRLRVGFLNFNPLYAGGLYVDALHAISRSQEMAPWRVGGDYDRPIPRRILEEAGLPRTLFGVRKAASAAVHITSPGDLSRAGCAAFERHRATMPRAPWGRRCAQAALVKLRSRLRKLARRVGSSSPAGGRLVEALIPVPQRYERSHEMDFALHWGHAHVRKRYAEAIAAGSLPALDAATRARRQSHTIERHGAGGAL